MKVQIKTVLLASVVMVATMFASCDDDKKCSPGTGGEVTLILKPQHHGDPIYNQPGYPDSAFIAIGATEFPGDDPTQYDLIATGVTGTDEVVVTGLKCGKYYVFMTGFDTSIVQRVKGGVPISFSETSGTLTKVIPITED